MKAALVVVLCGTLFGATETSCVRVCDYITQTGKYQNSPENTRKEAKGKGDTQISPFMDGYIVDAFDESEGVQTHLVSEWSPDGKGGFDIRTVHVEIGPEGEKEWESLSHSDKPPITLRSVREKNRRANFQEELFRRFDVSIEQWRSARKETNDRETLALALALVRSPKRLSIIREALGKIHWTKDQVREVIKSTEIPMDFTWDKNCGDFIHLLDAIIDLREYGLKKEADAALEEIFSALENPSSANSP